MHQGKKLGYLNHLSLWEEGNGAGTRMDSVVWVVAGQMQFMFYRKTDEKTWKEF